MTKSIRLTNQVREEILKTLLDKGFSEKKKALEARRNELSIKVYNDVFSKKDFDLMQSLPQGWLPGVTEMKVQFGGTFSGVCQRQFQEPVRMPHKHVSYGSTNILKVYEDSHKYTVENDKITDDVRMLKSEMIKAEAQTKAVLYSCNTTRALKDAWPEIAIIVEAHEPAEGSQNETALVPVANGLNSILGL
jgi:hypothetical protein